MTNDAELESTLVAYVDGELDERAVAEVERLMATNPAVRDDIAMFRQTAMLLRAACGEQHYRSAPAATRQPAAVTRRLTVRRTALAVAAGVALILAGFGAGFVWHAAGSDELLDEAAEYHAVFSRETDHLAELPPARAGEFASWMQSRLGTHLTVPDLSAAGLTYAGGRMLVIDQAPVADFLYARRNGPPIALCVARTGAAASPLAVDERHSLRIAHWSRDGNTYLLVGAMDAATARRIADLAAPQV